MRVNVCVPTLKRYDCLAELVTSLNESELVPEKIYVVDNGRNPDEMQKIVRLSRVPVHVKTPERPMGVAESWNWFIRNVPEERLIVNDDVTFSPGDLRTIASTPGAFVSALPGSNACSCFLIRDVCVDRVGLFDERISPGYAYFEDCDYVERMILANVRITPAPCGVEHKGSQTLAVNTPREMNEHHARFIVAERNFKRKWGRAPDLSRPIDWKDPI